MKKIVFIADQVCADSARLFPENLQESAEIWSPEKIVDNSVQLLAGLSDWVLKRQPDFVLLCLGRGDTRRVCMGENESLVPLAAFERNLRLAQRMILERSTAVPVFVTIAPVDCRKAKVNGEGEAEFPYDNETIALYNEEAKAIAEQQGIEFWDLYGFVKSASRDDSVRPDGLRFDNRGCEKIGAFLSAKIRGL